MANYDKDYRNHDRQPQQRPIVHHHIVLKPHHKWILGGAGTVVIVLLITLSIFTYTSYVKEELNYRTLNQKLSDLQKETQNNINSLSSSLLDTNNKINSISSDVGNISQQFSKLKASASDDFSSIIETSIPAVVTIKTDVAQGTGFIISGNGYVVTNEHVIDGGSYIQAVDYNQNVVNAQLIGYDQNLDIALLKIQGNYSKLSLGDSSNVQVGQKVIAIGNPLGLQFSVSQGIISAINRQGPNGLDAYFQTDASLNPGNSGGPLIDTNGDVIGINNFKASGSENVGFALESNYIKQAVNSISHQALNQTLV